MANARPMFILVFLFAALLANAQPSSVQNGAQPSSLQAGAAADQSTHASEQAQQAVPAGSTDGAASSTVDAQKEKPASAVPPRAKPFLRPRYTELRRGRDQEIAVLLCPGEDAFCWLPDARIKNPPIPMSLQMDPAEGFTIRYGAPKHYESTPMGTPSYPGDHRLIFIKVHAGKNVSLGEHVLKGTMVFRTGSNSGETETLAIEIPEKVVDHDAPTVEIDWPYVHHPGRVAEDVGRSALLVLLLPVLPIYGLIMCGSIDCHD